MTAPRFLIDENLSPALVEPARRRRFEAMHVNHLGLRTETDWDLLKVIAEQDWVLVPNNAIEFRGRFREVELHPSVIFLLPTVRRMEQLDDRDAALQAARGAAREPARKGDAQPGTLRKACANRVA